MISLKQVSSCASQLANNVHQVNRCLMHVPRPWACGLQAACYSTRLQSMTQTHTVRDCQRGDVQEIKNMCKDVYEGGDYMPRMIDEYLKYPECILLIAEAAGKVDGLACATLRGSMVFVFGLRVRAEERGKGLAKVLMECLLQEAKKRFPSAKTVASTTARSNIAAQKILGALLGPPLPQLDIWPPAGKTQHLSDYEASLGWPDKKASKEQTLLSFIPGALNAIWQDTHALTLLPNWTVASTLEEAHRALLALRTATGEQNSDIQAWFPYFYEMWPARSEFVAAALRNQRLWILKDSKALAVQGAVMLSPSPECRRFVAGIVASSSSVIHSALALVAQHEPHFIAVIDRITELHESSEPAIYKSTGTVSDCLPYLKRL